MTMFAYQSMDASGKRVSGTMDAANMLDLEMRLKRMGLDLIDCQQRIDRHFSLTKKTVKRKDLINFCFHMEQMTRAGVPVLEGLADLRDGMDNPRFKEIVADLMENIEGGLQLSEALERYPKIFNRTFTSLIKTGEQSGELSEIFLSLSETLKWQDELFSQTKKIITYPSVVAVIVFGVMGFLMVRVVPQLVSFIKTMGGELPAHTKALIIFSNLIVYYWPILVLLPILSLITFKVMLKKSPALRYKADGVKLRLWLVGPVLKKIILTRFATFFALMYASGITILDSIRLSEEIVDNQVIAAALRQAGLMISEGQSVSVAFQNTGIFPPLVIRMLKIGEATGSLDTALRNVSYAYNREVKEMIDRVQALIGPALTVVLGLMLGWIMLSVLGPIYDIFDKIK